MNRKKPKKEFTTTWVFEAFDRDPTFCERRMFGGLSAYLRGRMVMCLMEYPGDQTYRGKSYPFDIWDGILLPTEREFHRFLIKDFAGLVAHPVLGKWLYLPARHEDFETVARKIAVCIARGDKRFGVEPSCRERNTGKGTPDRHYPFRCRSARKQSGR